MATYFHLLAQMKVGKAKCLNASDPTELHGWKESSVDAEHLCSTTGSSAQKTCEKRERLGATGQYPDATATPSCRSS